MKERFLAKQAGRCHGQQQKQMLADLAFIHNRNDFLLPKSTIGNQGFMAM
ncbi:hypothetical protein [Undibacterium sp. TC4M20W]